MDFREYEKKFMKIRQHIEKGIYTDIVVLNMEAYKSKEPLSFDNRFEGEFFIPEIGKTWGDLFDCAWFHFTGTLPESAVGKKCVLQIDFSGEGLVYTPDGEILQGLTSMVSRDEFPLGLWGKKTIEITECAAGGEVIDIWVDAGCNDVEGQYKNDGKVKEAKAVTLDTECRSLFYDFMVCQSLYVGLCENNNPYGEEIRPIIEEASDILTELNTYTCKEARRVLSKILSRENDDFALTYSSIGHSHLDLLFLWPLRETIRKAARTFSTVLKMMNIYPEYKFTCSQPPLYIWMKKHYPALYEKIISRIKEGRWEVSGSFYVECDTNLPCGESLVRQLIYGKQFFIKEFGLTMEVGFLPDVFGYSGALPQLLVKSETPYFMTQKLSMNDTNRFPRHTFWWQGIDGSRVLTHMLPEDSYNSAAVPQMAIYGLHHYKDLDKCSDALQLYGLGDGGGGAGYEHFERKRRMKNLKGCPSHRDEFVIDFFHRIEKNKDTYRSWQGEFYFERHQGTYTSIAKAKKYNRQIEQALHTLEWLSVMAEVKCGLTYPKEKIKKIWEDVLLYQFHDCLPGSAIKRVYEEAYERYNEILREIELMTEDAVKQLLDVMSFNEPEQVVCFNPAPVEREEYIKAWNKEKKCIIPAYGICTISMKDAVVYNEQYRENVSYCLENSHIRAEFTKNGTLSVLINKANGFSMLKEGEEGNKLLLYNDELTHWDINKDYLLSEPEQAELLSINEYARGSIKGIILNYKIGSSLIEQEVTLRDNSARLDFATKVDWREEYKMLRTVFPTSVITDEATCEIQFGHIKRPTHTNTSWDEAKFEVCAHKWADISDKGSGLSLLNNCKYGYKLWNNTLDLCLLRSQNCPCENGDFGVHEFTYSLYPHTGDVYSGGVINEGYLLNYPLITVLSDRDKNINNKSINNHKISEYSISNQNDNNQNISNVNINNQKLNNQKSNNQNIIYQDINNNIEYFDMKNFNLQDKTLLIAECDRDNIIIETVKKAEEGDGYIIRLYDAAGMRTRAALHFRDFSAEAVCNLLEEPMTNLNKNDRIELEFHPFEVHTLLVKQRYVLGDK